jgi:hypothetical protein
VSRTTGAAQPGGAQARQEHPGVDQLGTRGHGGGEQAFGDVVVIALETPSRDPECLGELVQLVVAHVAHEVRPPLTSEPPAGRVNQDRHPVSVPRR